MRAKLTRSQTVVIFDIAIGIHRKKLEYDLMDDKQVSETFELAISPEFLEEAEQHMTESLEKYGDPKLFTAYNRGGGPKGQYDRHYDKSTG